MAVSRNIFTTKTGEGFYCYHSLFRQSLLKTVNQTSKAWLQQKAAQYYYDTQQYKRAAQYAMDAKDTLLLEKVILACYREYIKASNYSELHIWLQALDDWAVEMSPAIRGG